MSFLYEDEQNDLGQKKFEESYGGKLSSWYEKNFDQAVTEGYTPDRLAQDMFRAGRRVEEGDTYETWAQRNGVNRFVESASFRVNQYRQQREDEEVRQNNLANRGDLMRGLASGVDETQAILGGGGMALLGKLAGNNAVGNWLKTKGSEYYTEQMREASLNPTKQLISDKEGQWISDDIQGGGDLLDWAQGEFGKLLPTMALGLLSGGVGAGLAAGTKLGGRAVAAPLMRSFVESQAKRLVPKLVAKNVSREAAEAAAMQIAKKQIGGRAGAWIGTSLLETSGSFAEAVNHMREKYVAQGMRPEDALLQAHEDASGMLALGTGVLAGGIELLGGNIKILDKVLGKEAATAAQELINIAKSSRATPSIIGRSLNAAKQLFLQAAKEAPSEFSQEAAQELLNIANVDFADPDFQFASQETIKQALAAGAAGAVGGGVAAFGSATYDKARGGSASKQVADEASRLKRLIENQKDFMEKNPNKAADVQESLAKNEAELAKLTGYMSMSSESISYVEAAKRINEAVPSPDGKKFTTRALKRLIVSDRSPVAEMKDEAGKPMKGYVDPASVQAHIDMRKAESGQAVAEEAATPAETVVPPATPAVAEGAAPVAPMKDEPADMPPAPPMEAYDEENPPAQVEDEGTEYEDPKYMRRGFTSAAEGKTGLGRKVVEPFVKGSRLSKISQVFEDISELDTDVQDAVRRSKGENEQAFYYKGKTYFNASKINSKDELVHAVAHEIMHPAEEAHGRALSRELGVEGARQSWEKTLDHVYKSFTKDIQKLYTERYAGGNIDMKTAAGRRKMVSEFLAEKHATAGDKDPAVKKWYQRIFSAVRKMVNAVRRSIGMEPMKMNDEEVMAVIKEMNKSYDQAVKSGEEFTGNGEPQFIRGWARYDDNGYEVSTQGDKRFSALNAKLKDGRTIEEAYQVGVKGYASIKEGKGKPPKTKMSKDETWAAYKALWQQWAGENPDLIKDLRTKAAGKVLTDKFAATDVSQARALSEIIEAPVKTASPTRSGSSAGSFEIVSRGKGDFDGMRGPKGETMMTKGIKPGDPGWLGNPHKWSGNGGPKNVTLEQAISAFEADFVKKMSDDPEFKQAVLDLKGKKVGYYQPDVDNHLRVVQDYIREHNNFVEGVVRSQESASANIGEARTFAGKPGAPHVAEKKLQAIQPPKETRPKSQDAEFGGARTQFAQEAPTVKPGKPEPKGYESVKIEFPKGEPISSPPTVGLVKYPAYEGKMEYGYKHKGDEAAQESSSPAPTIKEKDSYEKKQSFIDRGFEEEVDQGGNKTGRLVSKLSDEQKRQLGEIAEPDETLAPLGGKPKKERKIFDPARTAVRRKLIAEGGMSLRTKPLVSIEIPSSPDFKHKVFGKFGARPDYGFYESAKAYWNEWREAIVADIEGNATMRQMPPIAKALYERMLVLERGFTIMSGKLSSEVREGFEATIARIEARGAEEVDGRISEDLAMQIVDGLRQAISERGKISREEFLAANIDMENLYRFAHFLRGAAIMRPGLVGAPVDLTFKFRDYAGKNLQWFDLDMGKGSELYDHLTMFYGDILSHLAKTGALNEEQAKALDLSNNGMGKYAYHPLHVDESLDQDAPINLTMSTLENILGGVEEVNRFLIPGRPLPILTTRMKDGELVSELSEVLERFHALKHKDPNLAALREKDFIVGIIGMGIGYSQVKGSGMDPRIGNVYDADALTKPYLEMMKKAGFLSEVTEEEGPKRTIQLSYRVNDKFTGVLAEIRGQSFMKDMDQKSDPRRAFYFGEQLLPQDLVLAELRAVRPGSILLNPGRKSYGVLGPVMENGKFEIMTPQVGPGGKTVLMPARGKDGKPLTFSKFQLTKLGYVHVPAIWDFVPGHDTAKGFQAHNVFSWVNAESAMKSRDALAQAEADTSLDGLAAMGHGKIVVAPGGQKFLALASQGENQVLLEIVGEDARAETQLQDAMSRLHGEIRDTISELVDPNIDDLTESRMKRVRATIRKSIDSLLARRQISESEAENLRSEMAAFYKAVVKALPEINESSGPIMSRVYHALGKSGFLSSEQVQEQLVLQEIMGASTELQDSGKTVDETAETQAEGSGYFNAAGAEIMAQTSLSETLRELLGLDATEGFARAYENLKWRVKTASEVYRQAIKDGYSPRYIEALYKNFVSLRMALRAVHKNDLSFAVATDKQDVSDAALKEARAVLGERSAVEPGSADDVIATYTRELLTAPFPTKWLTEATSPLFLAAPKRVRGLLRKYLFIKEGNTEGLSTVVGGQETFTLGALYRTSHPNAQALTLHLLSVLSSMRVIEGHDTSMLAANVAYYGMVRNLPVRLKDGTTKRLSELPKAEQKLVTNMLASGGLYAKLLGALKYAQSTEENGERIWGADPKVWPAKGSEDAEALYRRALEMKLDSRQSALGIMAALDLPKSEMVDTAHLALRLGTLQIPADAAMMLEGMSPEERREIYDTDAFKPERVELFLQNSDAVYLRPEEFVSMMEDAAANGLVDSFDEGWFESDGIVYKELTEEKLVEEDENNSGVETRLDNGVITGYDYELLMAMKEIAPEFFKFSGGRITRDGRSSMVNIRGELYPINHKDKTISEFGLALLEGFRRLHDEAWTNQHIPEYERVRIREQMLAWERFANQHGSGHESTLRFKGNFRTAARDSKHKLRVNEAKIPEFMQDLREYVNKLLSSLVSLGSGQTPKVVIHGIDEDATVLLETPEGRALLPHSIHNALRAKGNGKAAMTKLRRTMGLVTEDGAIHIFPALHADAAGNIDKIEVARTVFHEAVGHIALRKILGAEYETFMLSVFAKHVDPEKKLSLTRDMKIHMAEEHVATMAEKISYNSDAARLTNAHIGTILDRVASMIMRAFRKMMKKAGFNVEISKTEIRDLLRIAFESSEVKAAGLGFMGPAMIPAENLGAYDNFRDYEPNLADRFLRNVSDKLRYWELLFRSKEFSGERIKDEQNFMYGMRTLSSRIGFLTGVAADFEDEFIAAMKETTADQASVGDIILALHTVERNAVEADAYLEKLPVWLKERGNMKPAPEEAARGITEDDKIAMYVQKRRKTILAGRFRGATGRTTKWAEDTLATAKAAGFYDNGLGSAAKAVDIVLRASEMSLEVAEQAGMISREEAGKFREKYKFFVPIPGFSKAGFGEVGGFRLQGRSRFAADFDAGLVEQSDEVPDIIASTFANLRHRIVEGELNKTNQLIAQFAMDNPNAGVFTTYLHPHEVELLKRSEEVVGYEGINDEEQFMAYASQHGFRTMPMMEEAGVSWDQDRMREYEERNGLVPVYQNGVLRYFRIEHEGLRRSYGKFTNPAKQGLLMRQLGKINRWLIGMNTMLNPEFLIPNLFRDAGAAMNTLAIQGAVAGTEKAGPQFVKEFAPRIRLAMKVLYAQNFGKDMAALGEKEQVLVKYLQEFESSGGKIQWPFMASAAETMKNLQEAVNVAQGKGTLLQKSKAFKDAMKDFMKRSADIFENATRLSAYVTARESGASVERASMLSRDLTVDFDRRGDLGQTFNTLYLFANAGLQGTLVIARAIRNNPQRAAKHLSGFIALSFSLALANILMGGDGEDGEPSYFLLPEETRNGNLVLMLPFSDGTPVRIPLPYGYAFFWAIGQEMANAIFDRRGAGHATLGVMSSLLNNFNPLESAAGLGDAHGWVRLFAPTIVDPFVDVGFEQTAFGTPLMPEKTFDQQPDSTRHWRSVSTTSKEAARLLNQMFGGSGGKSSGITDISPETLDLAYDNVTGGLGKFLARTTGLIMSPLSGRELSANDLPILRRFIGGKLNWEDRGRFKANYAEIHGANRTYKNLKDNVAMAQIPELRQQATRDRDDFYQSNKHILLMRGEANRVRSSMGKIDKLKEQLYKSGLPDSETAPKLKELDERQRRILAAFNERYYRVVDSR